MGTKSDLVIEVKRIFASAWTKRDGKVVPEDTSVTLGNVGVILDATVLYADLSESTVLVDNHEADFAAEIYKAYLLCEAKIISDEGGEITAYDGDRIMAVFIGDAKNSSAARAALKINWAVDKIINPAIAVQYGSNAYAVKRVVGIDSSQLMVAKTGIRNANDLVWVGRAANYAAKLCGLSSYSTYITKVVYDKLSVASKFASDGENMWAERVWTAMKGERIYGSNHIWEIS